MLLFEGGLFCCLWSGGCVYKLCFLPICVGGLGFLVVVYGDFGVVLMCGERSILTRFMKSSTGGLSFFMEGAKALRITVKFSCKVK